MNDEIELPFSQVLDSLFAEESLQIRLLFRLSDMSESEFDEFGERWRDVPEERRRVIVRHLADISEDNFVVDFLPVFVISLNDEAATVRIAALDGIWDATRSSLVAPVINLFQCDESLEVRAAAASALAHFILLSEWGQLPNAVSLPIVEALLAEYDNPATVDFVKRATLEALAASSHPRVPSLIREAYENGDPEMQLSAVFAMGGSADSLWLPILIDEMSNPLPEMRAEAARAVGSISDQAAIPDLANLAYDEDLSVAQAAVAGLGQIGGRRAYDFLTEIADDPELEALHEIVDEALEEISWLDGTFELLSIPDNEFEEN